MNYKKILLPVDINDKDSWQKTLPTAISLINNHLDCELHILSVIPNFGMSMMEEYFPTGWKKEIKAKTLTELESIVSKALPAEIKCSLSVERGVVYQVILETATKIEADLIIISSGHPSRKDYLLGPNVAKVTRHAEISVLVCR